MTEVGIRALKQNASAVVGRVEAGEVIVITDRGRPVAQLTSIPASRLEQLRAAGRVRPARRALTDLPRPRKGPSLTAELARMRDAERY